MDSYENLLRWRYQDMESEILRKKLISLSKNVKINSLYSYGEVYDMAYEGHAGDVKFYSQVAKKGKVLYIGPGTGRIFASIFKTNPDIIGVDYSRKMVKVLLKRYPFISSKNLLIRNIFSTNFKDSSFDKIVAPFSFLTQFNKNESLKLLKKVKKWLKPGGLFITDFFSANNNPLDKKIETRAKKINGNLVRKFFVYNHARKTLDEFTLLKYQGGILFLKLHLHSLFPNEISKMIEKAGFDKSRFYGGYKLQPLRKASEPIVLIIEKNELA